MAFVLSLNNSSNLSTFGRQKPFSMFVVTVRITAPTEIAKLIKFAYAGSEMIISYLGFR